MGKSLRHLQRHFVGQLALFVALSGTSFAAATLINGTQIKPHTTPKNRLTNSAVASLTGARGQAISGSYFTEDTTTGAKIRTESSSYAIQDGTGNPGWIVTVANDGSTAGTLHVSVICANVS